MLCVPPKKKSIKIISKMNRCTSAVNKMSLALVVVCVLLGLPDTTVARSGLQSEESAPPFKVQKCRISCLEKVRKVLKLSVKIDKIGSNYILSYKYRYKRIKCDPNGDQSDKVNPCVSV